MLRVVSVVAEPPSTLVVALSNGRTLSVDVSVYRDAAGYQGLSDPSVFASVAVDDWGHGITWPPLDQGVDVATLVRLHKEQTGQAFPVEAFNAWMERNHLSLTAAARALGLTRRAILYYHGGHHPIPRVVGLACTGWEAMQRGSAA
jgi:hypothetical protein